MQVNKKQNAEYFFQQSLNAMRQGQKMNALQNAMQAAYLKPKQHSYILQLCEILDGVEFSTFHPKVKEVILICLRAKGIHHQKLWKSWYSILISDPAMKEILALIKGNKPMQTGNFNDPYLLEGLKKITIHDMAFENALKDIYETEDRKKHYPKDFLNALETYASNCEYVFCDKPSEVKNAPIDQTIEVLSSPQNAVSKNVQGMYEQNPYPRWISCTLFPSNTKEQHDHLIAGCGTGFATCQKALMYPNVKFTAIDLCLASLSYAKHKAKTLGIKNIAFYQADILSLEKLDQQFDVIECSGVLHHMHAPKAGWIELLKKLKPSGKMHIGLYSDLARQDVKAARHFVKENNFPPSHDGISSARQAISNLPDTHEAKGVLNRADFYNTSGCRDLIFHVQEHCVTIPQIETLLEQLSLKFDGFDISNGNIIGQYRNAYPDDVNMLNLRNWYAFEKNNPRTFKGMYQFWCSSLPT